MIALQESCVLARESWSSQPRVLDVLVDCRDAALAHDSHMVQDDHGMPHKTCFDCVSGSIGHNFRHPRCNMNVSSYSCEKLKYRLRKHATTDALVKLMWLLSKIH